MKETLISYTAESVKAYLAGLKTETRRVMHPQPSCKCDKPNFQVQVIDWIGWKYEGREGWFCYNCGSGLHAYDTWSSHGRVCPYGQTGNILKVREALYRKDGQWFYRADDKPVLVDASDDAKVLAMVTWAHHKETDYAPARFMPGFAVRLKQTLSAVKIERLKEITEKAARAEGCEPLYKIAPNTYGAGYIWDAEGYRRAYYKIWDKINPKYPSESNPFVWVLSYPKY